MKKVVLIMIFALAVFTFIQCESNNEDLNPKILVDDFDFSTIKIDLKISNVLSTYNETNFNKKSKEIFLQIIKESNEVIKSNKKITQVVLNLKFVENKVYLESYAYLDSNKKIISKYIFNQNTYAKIPDLDGLFNGASCPKGYTQLASCGNLDETAACVSSAVGTYLANNISAVGDCANVQVNVGLFNTRVCGQGC